LFDLVDRSTSEQTSQAMANPAETTEPNDPDPAEAGLQLLVAEYTWVSGLIRYYREVELKALVGTGLVLSGVGAAFAALRASENPDAADAIGLVFAIGAWITAFAVPVVVMANMRGLRAVIYVREWLHPLASELARDARFLAWETVAGELYASLAGRYGRVLKPVLSAAVVVFLIGVASLALVVAAWTVEPSPWSRIVAAVAAGCDLIFMYVAFHFSRISELRENVPLTVLAELNARAARAGRYKVADGARSTPPRRSGTANRET
jgi:hypothetical protein